MESREELHDLRQAVSRSPIGSMTKLLVVRGGQREGDKAGFYTSLGHKECVLIARTIGPTVIGAAEI